MKFRKNSPKASLLILFIVLSVVVSSMAGLQFVRTVEAETGSAPLVSIRSPQNTTYDTLIIRMEISAFEPNTGVAWIAVSIDGEQPEKIYAMDVLPARHNVTAVAYQFGLPNGPHSVVASAAAYYTGIVGYSPTVYFTTNAPPKADITPPRIQILSPKNKTYDTTDIPLNFTVNEQVRWIRYSLDGQANVTIWFENKILSELSYGAHTLTVYANDVFNNIGASETINFTIAQKTEPPPPSSEPFPATCIAAATAVIAAGVVVFLIYFRKIRKQT